ncbi:Wzz/FepE/Etk N-terminal domain-containing protein [Nocardiopsis rhodophaea]|uniref:Wzz/FepE/Etk N-terminal domain-containing protein n=1 Tax=Nocardiopsis rhodophaea TaxID=280238 RepID=UPI0031E158A5
MQTATSEPELSDYLAMLRRQWHVVVAAALVGLVLAAVALALAPKTYTATTSVQVRPTGLAALTGERTGRTNGEVNLDTEAQVVRSARVARAAAKLLGTDAEPAQLRQRVDVTVPPNSTVLNIAYSAGTPGAARSGSVAFADAYLTYRRDEVIDRIDGHLASLRAEVEDRSEKLDTLTEATGDEEGSSRAQAEIRSVQREITDLNNQINPLNALRASLAPGEVLSPASTPESAASPDFLMWLASGMMLGLMAGLAAAYVRERRDPRLHSTRELRKCTSTPVLLDFSEDGPGSVGGSPTGLISASDPAGQRVHGLAHTLGARSSEGGRVVLVPGVSSGPSGITVATNLAAALARIDTDVLLICADPDDGAARALLGIPPGPGLAEVLTSGADPGHLACRPAGVPGLRVLRFGESDATGLLQCGAMAYLLRTVRGGSRYVVVACAPMSERADAQAMAGVCDLVLPVVELGRTPGPELRAALDRFEAIGADVPGLVAVPTQAPDGTAATAGAAAASDPTPDAPVDGAQEDTSSNDDLSSAAPSLRR